MTTENYLIIENNVVTNSVMWNGDVSTWSPPENSVTVVADKTTVLVWVPVIEDNKVTDYVLQETKGFGEIGFTWNGSVLTTNKAKPEIKA